MSDDHRPDFDINGLLQGALKMIGGAKGVADNAKKAAFGFVETIAALNRAAKALELLVTRVNQLVEDFEAPMRAMTPEFEKAAARMQRLTDALDGPIDRMLPSLENAIATVDRVATSGLPESMEFMRTQLFAMMDAFSELPKRMGSFGEMLGLDRFLGTRPPAPGRPVSAPATPPAPVAPSAGPAPVYTPTVRKAAPARPRTAVRKTAAPKVVNATSTVKKAAPRPAPAKRNAR